MGLWKRGASIDISNEKQAQESFLIVQDCLPVHLGSSVCTVSPFSPMLDEIEPQASVILQTIDIPSVCRLDLQSDLLAVTNQENTSPI